MEEAGTEKRKIVRKEIAASILENLAAIVQTIEGTAGNKGKDGKGAPRGIEKYKKASN